MNAEVVFAGQAPQGGLGNQTDAPVREAIAAGRADYVLSERKIGSGAGVAAAPCTNTRIPLETHDTAASALVACVFRSIMRSL